MISIITASNNNNLKLAQSFEQAFSDQDKATRLYDLVAEDLPLYTPKYHKENGTPERVVALVDELLKASGFVFVGPEYNGGIPPTLSNLIAWVSVSTKSWRDCFNGKTAAIGTHSGSGGMLFLASLRLQLSYIGLNVLGRQIHTHYQKELNPDSLAAIVSEF